MSKQFIYFAGVLFLMTAAILAVSAQEDNSVLNNTIMNITMNTTMNNTTLNASINQTQNQTLNATAVQPINATSNETLIAVPVADLNVTANETLNQTELNETIPVQNEIVQNETLPALNETTPASNEIIPIQNETTLAQNVTVPAQNTTVPENVGLQAEPAIIAGAAAAVSQPISMEVGSFANPVFVIGVGPKTGETTRLGGYSQTQTFELGSPAKPVVDLGNIAFNFNVI